MNYRKGTCFFRHTTIYMYMYIERNTKIKAFVGEIVENINASSSAHSSVRHLTTKSVYNHWYVHSHNLLLNMMRMKEIHFPSLFPTCWRHISVSEWSFYFWITQSLHVTSLLWTIIIILPHDFFSCTFWFVTKRVLSSNVNTLLAWKKK